MYPFYLMALLPLMVAAAPGSIDATTDSMSDEAYVADGASEVSAPLSAAEEAAIDGAFNEEKNDEPTTREETKPQNFKEKFQSFMQKISLDIALTGDFALAWFSADNLQTGAHDPTKLGFNLQQLELYMGAAVDHIFRTDANLVFSLAGVELEEAYVTTLALPGGLQVRAGQFLSRIGRLNATHPHSWDFVDQPFVIGKMYGSEGNRGLGLEISWLTPLPWYVEIVGSAQMSTSSASNRSFLNTENEITGFSDFLYTAAIKQFFAMGKQVGLFWGISAQFGPNNTGRGNRTNIYASDLHLKFSPAKYPEMFIVLQAEIFLRTRQIPGDMLFDGAGYAELLWQINKFIGTAVRGEYGSGLLNDYLDPAWTKDRWRAAYQLTWTPSHFTRIRGQASVDIPKWLDKPIWALFLALEFTAGSHPAHNY